MSMVEHSDAGGQRPRQGLLMLSRRMPALEDSLHLNGIDPE